MSDLIEIVYNYKNKGMSFDVIYDIGACEGNVSRALKGIVPDSKFFLFEANPEWNPTLQAGGWNFFNTVLSNPGRDSVLFYNSKNSGDSYYRENTVHHDTFTPVKMPCRTLDSIIQEYNLPIPNFIKIDTQGSELDILSGAESIIDKVDMIWTECPFIEYNKDSPNIHDYLEYFKSKNFIAVEGGFLKHEDTIVQLDVMFVRNDIKQKFFTPNYYIRPFA